MGIQIKGSNDTISASDGSMVLEGSALTFDNESITGISTMATGHITGTATIDDDLKVGISTLFVDKSAGRVGIGTDNPQVRLTVSSDSPAVMDVHHVDGGTDDEARIILGALALNPPNNRGAGIAALNNGAGHDLLIKCSASHAAGPTEKVRVTSAGLVGINSTAPSKKLEVQGLDVALRLKSTVGTGRIGMEFYDTAAQKGFLGYPSSGNDNMSLQQNEAADLYFYVNGGDRLHIKSTGLIGIGTADPGQTLHLSAASGDVYNRVDTNVNGGMLIYVQGTQRTVIANDSAFSGTQSDTGIGAKGNLIFRAGTSSYDERMRITSDGQVGVNTSTFNTGSKLESSSEGAYNIVARSQNGNGGYHNFTGQSSGGTVTSYITHNGRGYFEDGVQFDSSGEVLDSYEEGTWTPDVRIETRAASDSPIDNVEGCYTKVGKLVTCHGKFQLNGTPSERSTSRAIELRGFPFDHNHDWDKISGDIRVTGHDIGSTYGDDIYFVMRMISGQQYARIELVEQSYNGTRNASVVMQDDMYVLFTFTYVTV